VAAAVVANAWQGGDRATNDNIIDGIVDERSWCRVGPRAKLAIGRRRLWLSTSAGESDEQATQ
jgi:hypothetical protein